MALCQVCKAVLGVVYRDIERRVFRRQRGYLIFAKRRETFRNRSFDKRRGYGYRLTRHRKYRLYPVVVDIAAVRVGYRKSVEHISRFRIHRQFDLLAFGAERASGRYAPVFGGEYIYPAERQRSGRVAYITFADRVFNARPKAVGSFGYSGYRYRRRRSRIGGYGACRILAAYYVLGYIGSAVVGRFNAYVRRSALAVSADLGRLRGRVCG